MANTWRSFLKGWRTATSLWQLVLLFYLVETALALILAVPPAAQLAEVFGHSAMAPTILGPLSLTTLLEAREGLEGTSHLWPLYLLVLVIFLLVATFLRGGALAAMAQEPQQFCWTAYFSDCARFFGRFTLLLFLFLPGLILVGLVFALAGLVVGLIPLAGRGLLIQGIAQLLLLLFLMLLLLAFLDYARVSLVLQPNRSLWWQTGRALCFSLRRLPWVVLLELGFLMAEALIAATYPVLLQLSPFFGTLVPTLVAQQAVMVLVSWQRLAALGGKMALYRAFHPEGRPAASGRSPTRQPCRKRGESRPGATATPCQLLLS